MQAKTIKNTIWSKLLVAILAVSLVFTMMPLSMGAVYADQTEWNDSDVALVVGDTQLYRSDITALESVTAGEGALSVKGVKLSTIFETYLSSSTKPKVTINTADIGETPEAGKTQLIADKAAIGDYILAYEAGGQPIFQTSTIKPDAVGCFNLYDPNNLLNDQGNKLKTVLKMPAVIIDGGSGSGGGGGGDQPVVEVPDMTITGDALVSERVFEIKDIKKNIEIERFEGVEYPCLNNYGTEETYYFDGVYLIDLINYVGLKDGVEIEKIEAIPYNADGSVYTEKIQTYTLDEVTKANGSGLKAMFAWNETRNGESKKVQRTVIPQFGDEVNKSKWGSDIKKIIVTAKKEEPAPTPAPAPAVKDGQKATVGGSAYTVLSASAKTAAFTKAKNAKSVSVPATVKVNGKTLKVTQVNANAFKGKKIRTVTLGKNVKTVKAKAFNGSKAKTIIVKTKLLTKKSVKGSLKGSKVKTVKVKVGSKSVNKKYVKKYKKIFTKKNAGKKVKVKR